MTVRKEFISKEKVQEHIEALKAGYVESYVNTLKIPSFIYRCKEGIEKTPEKKEMLEKAILEHERLIVENEEQMKNLSEILDRVIAFDNTL